MNGRFDCDGLRGSECRQGRHVWDDERIVHVPRSDEDEIAYLRRQVDRLVAQLSWQGGRQPW